MTLLANTTTTAADEVFIPQYSARRVIGTWAAAAVPMGVLAWVGTPLLARALEGPTAFSRALILALTVGLSWQAVLVLWLVRREQGTLRWSVARRALWLQAPVSPRSGRRGGRMWWVLVPMTALFAAEELIPVLPHPASHDFSTLLSASAGHALLTSGPLWPAIVLVQMVLNTVLGEELLFRGLLLPRMSRTFGRWDWLVNGLLFATYHLHQPWTMPGALVDTFALAYPARRYRSAVLSILAHSSQSVFFAVAAAALLLG
ncbi:MAG TPA: CPBP family intramembrane glutamic endopeptidase [Actinomycetales bacterium]|jgi:membrane protease YdiL (CAAX protease family)|nr:CPBP family intramembrane glutamic endopeptidase [Actinomycetales bacterium]